ncbi:hypothetical protein WN943_025571 [Citrus x changshan-huyou]
MRRAPYAQVIAFEELKPYGANQYGIEVDYWRNTISNSGKEPYKTLPGDILVLADFKPEKVSDLRRVGRTWTFVSVTTVPDDEDENKKENRYKVKARNNMQVRDRTKKSFFLIYLTNILPNKRIWNSLHMRGNWKVITQVLGTDSVVDERCELCSVQRKGQWDEKFGPSLSSTLNESQVGAMLACLRRLDCDHRSGVELIWGPPGTGKTKTVSMLLLTLLRIKCRTLACTPTNVAITELASRVLKLVKESYKRDSRSNTSICPLGDILLFGNKDRLKVNPGFEEIYLNYRIKKLRECFAPLSGWRHCFSSMIDLLADCVSQYHIYVEKLKEREDCNVNQSEEKECRKETEGSKGERKPFLKYVRERFKCAVVSLRNCIFIFCTHLPKSYISENSFQEMVALKSLLDSFGNLLFQDNVVSKELEKLFSHSVDEGISWAFVRKRYLLQLHQRRSECLSVLRNLWNSLDELNLPCTTSKLVLEDFCFKRASLFFSTASSSYKLHSVEIKPLNFLVIDEAAQLKESESTIPLQLAGINHAVLIGDECQLPAMVESKISDEAGFGRSLFERLTSLNHSKHLLNIQYRMHPSISLFPNLQFYRNQILDGANVKSKSYEKQYLTGTEFGTYSFINIIGGREDFIYHSCRNIVEVSAVIKILQKLYKAIGIPDSAVRCFNDLGKYEGAGRFDELLMLENGSGNFMEAANMAVLEGDIFLATDLLQKAWNFREASKLVLNFVFSNSLWSPGSRGWPLKQFTQKEELLQKAKSLAKNDSNQFYEFVCAEADILSNDHSNLVMMNQQFIDSKRHQNIRGEILSSRMILDFHLHSNASTYHWEDELVLNLTTYSDDRICKSQVSIETFVYFWNCWKDKIVKIFEYLGCLRVQQDVDGYRSYEDFCLSYFSVWKHCSNLDTTYLLLKSDAYWVRELSNMYIQKRGQLVSIDLHQLVSAAQSYWSTELLSVGINVLDKLEALHEQSIKNSLSVLCQSKCLSYIYDVAKFLLDSEFLYRHWDDVKTLQKFVELSTEDFFRCIFPLDWRESLSKDMISLRQTEVCRSILEEIVSGYVTSKSKLSYGQIGRIAVMILGSGKLHNGLYRKVVERCVKDSPWQAFLKCLSQKMEAEYLQHPSESNNERELYVIQKLHGALLDTYGANWRKEYDYMSPAYFLYLLERLLILMSCFQGYIFTTKSSFVDWRIYQEPHTNPTASFVTDVWQSFGDVLDSIFFIVQHFLYNEKEMIEWISNSHKNVNDYHSLVVLRLVVIICLLHLNFGKFGSSLRDLLGRKYAETRGTAFRNLKSKDIDLSLRL